VRNLGESEAMPVQVQRERTRLDERLEHSPDGSASRLADMEEMSPRHSLSRRDDLCLV
jgi:hypothetical protein